MLTSRVAAWVSILSIKDEIMRFMKKHAFVVVQIAALVALMLGTTVSSSAATTISFGSIPTTPATCLSGAPIAIPAGFGGFTWDPNLGVECNSDYTATFGNTYGAPSGNAIYNTFATTSEVISRGTDFQFDGALISGWTIDNLVDLADGVTAQTVTINAYLGGVGGTLVGTETVVLDGNDGDPAMKYVNANGLSGAIDTLQITTDSNFWLLDDFQYEDISVSSVPEPASVVLLAIGLVGLLAARRARKHQENTAS